MFAIINCSNVVRKSSELFFRSFKGSIISLINHEGERNIGMVGGSPGVKEGGRRAKKGRKAGVLKGRESFLKH